MLPVVSGRGHQRLREACKPRPAAPAPSLRTPANVSGASVIFSASVLLRRLPPCRSGNATMAPSYSTCIALPSRRCSVSRSPPHGVTRYRNTSAIGGFDRIDVAVGGEAVYARAVACAGVLGDFEQEQRQPRGRKGDIALQVMDLRRGRWRVERPDGVAQEALQCLRHCRDDAEICHPPLLRRRFASLNAIGMPDAARRKISECSQGLVRPWPMWPWPEGRTYSSGIKADPAGLADGFVLVRSGQRSTPA